MEAARSSHSAILINIDCFANGRLKIRERLSACRDEINDLIRDVADRKPRANVKYCRVGVGLYQIDNSAPE